MLPPEQQFYLKNNLKLLLSQAQLALLDGRQYAYSDSLTTAVSWLEDYFPLQESANQTVLEALQRLSKLTITSEYPDVSDSLIAIKAVIAEQHRISQGHVAADEDNKNKDNAEKKSNKSQANDNQQAESSL